MKKILPVILFIFVLGNSYSQKSQIQSYEAEDKGYFINPSETPYGVVFTDNYASKIYLLKGSGNVKTLVKSAGCGRYFTVSPDGNFISYKSINTEGKQAPAYFSLKENRSFLLSEYIDKCSQLSVTNEGKYVYSEGKGPNFPIIISNIADRSKSLIIDNTKFSGIILISPDGNSIVFDIDQQYFILADLNTTEKKKLPNDGKGVIYPKWSPDSKKILFQNKESELFVYETETGELYHLGKGGAGNWDASSENIVYHIKDADPVNFIFKSSELFISDYKGKIRRQITNTSEVYEMTPSFDSNGNILYQTYDKRQIIRAKLDKTRSYIISSEVLLDNPKDINPEFYNVSKFSESKSITHLTNPVPYVHQLYDAPTGRNGNAACAPTTSVMALAYYNRLPKWPVEANNYTSVTGSDHYSDYSGYVLDRYKYNEHSFDAYSSTKNAYGGYAYMWVSPYSSPGSGGMPNFQDHHDMESNWFIWTSQAYFSNTTTEIDNEYPHPICSWITHSGHLTLAVGYVNGQHTLIFNDPWGDKNTAGYPSYDGLDAYYDWPGYNNGYQNLDPDGSYGTVAWTITAQSSEPVYDDLTIENINYDHGFYINNWEDGSTQRYYRHVNDAAGHSGHIWWTGGEGGASSDICWVTWTPNIPADADYRVEVFIPGAFTDTYSSAAVTSSANYKIYYDGGNTTVQVDQLANQNSWVELGTFQFRQGQNGYVYLGDAVNSSDNGKKVLFDAVRYTLVSIPFEVDVTNVTCKGNDDGTATVTSVPGSAPYVYVWSHDAGNTSNTATNLAPGTYTVTVTNQENDTYENTFTITEAEISLSLSCSSTNPSTVGGTNGEIIANISGGGEPYEITWSHDGSNTTNTASNLSAGSYTVFVTDAYGCQLQETVILTDPDCCTLLYADFSTGLPSGWSNTVNSGGYASYVWSFDDPGNRYSGGSLAGADFDADFAIFDDDALGDNGNKSDASLTTKAIDCSGKNYVLLKMTHRFRHSDANPATGKLEVSIDGSSWDLIESWSAATEGATIREWDISAYAANEPTVYIRWTYTDDSNWSNYWAIDNVEVYAPLSGTFTVRTDGTGDYGSLTDAINDLNYCGVGNGGVTFLVEAEDVFTEELPVITESGTSVSPISFITSDASSGNPVLRSEGSVANDDAAFKIAGGDYITFDGIDVEISTGSALEYGWYFYNVSPTDGCQHNTVKNCSITLNNTNENSKGIFQYIQTGTIDPTSANGANSYNTYQNINITDAYHGIDLFGYDVSGQDALYDDACIVSNCTVSNFGLSGASSDRATGILTWSQKNISIDNNLIYTGTSVDRTLGIYCAGNNIGDIYNNTVYDLYGEGLQVAGIREYESDMNIFLNEVYDIEGINMATGIEGFGGTTTVYNNYVFDIKAPSGNSTSNGYPSARGISFRYTSGTQNIYYNTVYIAYNSGNSGNESTCMYLDNSTADLRNNIFENNTSATTGTRANVLYFKGASDLSNLSANTDHNLYYNGVATEKYALAYDAGNTVSYLDLAAYLSVSPNDANSIEEDPPFKSTSSPYDMHIDITQTTNIDGGGIPVTGITEDFDGDSRDLSTPDIGADEFSPAGVLCGTYTIDNTSVTGGTNFNNFSDAINALNDRGISCSVIFNVQADQIFAEDPPEITASGTSGNTIIFQRSGSGLNPVLQVVGTSANDDHGIKISGGDYFTFDGINIQVTSGNDLEYGYFLTNITGTDGARYNTIKNCTITLDKSNSNSSGIMQLIDETIDPADSNGANSFNTYENITIENAYHGFKIFGYDVSGQETLYDDGSEIINCTVNNFGGQNFRAVGILTWSQQNLDIHGNTITNGSSPSYISDNDGRCIGIYTAGNASGNIYNNTVYTLSGVGAQVAGLRAYSSEVDFYNNMIYDISGEDMAAGIEIFGGTSYIYNNFVRDIRTPNEETYGHPTTKGISNRTGTAYIYNNSILLNYTSTVSTNESAGIFTEGFYGATASSDIRNNIVVNKVDVSNGAIAAALYKSAEYSNISTNSDNNLYFSGTPTSKNLIFYDTNNAYQTINDYKTYCSIYEQNSVSEDAPFVSSTDLHILSSAISYIDGGAQVIGMISGDYDNDPRDPVDPDIGADEYECDFIVWKGTIDTDWASAENWQKKQIPTSSDDIIIPDVSADSGNFPIITCAAETNDLSILSGANIHIDPNYSLSVYGTADNQAGINGLIIESDAGGTGSFINASSSVPGTVERFLSGTQWHFLTAPVIDAPLSLFNTNNFYYYDETTEDSWSGGTLYGTMGWIPYTNPTLTTMQGYAYYFNETTVNFEGDLHAGTYVSPLLSWTNTPVPDQFEGWHLLGNPYPSAIDFSSANIDASNIILTDLDQSVYYYDDDIHAYRSYNVISGGINGGTQYIPAMQGFFIHANANNAQLQITNGARTHNNTNFYKGVTENDYILMKTNANGYSDEAKLIEFPGASFAYDGMYDLYKMYSADENVPQIWFIHENEEISLNAVPSFSEDQVYLMGFSLNESNNCSIELSETNTIYDLFLLDKVMNISQNLIQDPVYNFIHEGGPVFDRFELHLSNPGNQINENDLGISVFPNPSTGLFTIQNSKLYHVDVEVFDITGKEIIKLTNINSKIIKLKLSGNKKGIYLLKIRNKKISYTEKLVIQ